MNQSYKFFAEVVLPLALPRYFTYGIHEEMVEECVPGKRAIVQFGKKKSYSAIIRRVFQEPVPEYDVKGIDMVLDSMPIVHELQFKFWEWIASYYMCTIGEVYKAALPAGFKLESETKIQLNEAVDDYDEESYLHALSSKQYQIIQYLKKNKAASIKDINKLLDVKSSLLTVNKLLEKGLIQVEEKISDNYRPRYESFITIHPNLRQEENLKTIFAELERAPKQLHVLMSFLHETKFLQPQQAGKESLAEIAKKDLMQVSGDSGASIAALIKKDILIPFDKEVSRLNTSAKEIKKIVTLNLEQQNCLESIQLQFRQKQVVMLHGVTSSGKTELYIHLINNEIQAGKQVLYLLPEIALTSQIINRLKQVFGNKTGIYHSKFNDNERVEIWNSVNSHDTENKYQIILGVRSSIFLPFSNLGLIIVDEEHEHTFKQYDPAPRYHARDTAIYLATLHNAKVLLGTATPSVESYFNAKTGKYGFAELKQRHKNILLPEIVISDEKEARRKKQMKSHFTPILLSNMKLALDKNKQVILFQNRRGFSQYLECKTCSSVPKCKNCDVSLTYHKKLNHLVCHYCGYVEPVDSQCRYCGDVNMEMKGFGTEKIEDEISLFFPGKKTSRMDLDTTRGKKAHEKIIGEFERGETDILIGTQMVSKGLDFKNVTVVGILGADSLIHFPDFRAYEKAWQLMTQVSGRAGRKDERGKVIIQTSLADHWIIKDVVMNNYNHLFSAQIAERQQFLYPPFVRLIKIVLKHRIEQVVKQAANYHAQQLRMAFKTNLMGPETPLISRIQNLYLQQLYIKLPKGSSLPKSKQFLQQAFNHLKTKFKQIIVYADVDPM